LNSNATTARPPEGQNSSAAAPLLEVKNLTVGFATDDGPIRVLEDVSYSAPKGKTIGLVGESGCGKSVSVMTLMRLLPSPPSFVESGSILYEGEDILRLPESKMRRLRGNDIGMIFQEPMTSLNPTFSIGWQMAEPLMIHRGMGKAEAWAECLRLLDLIGVGGGKNRLNQYPHELSGGIRQRIMIAMALACEPKLLIADEPTTALDVTIQAQILELLNSLQTTFGMSILMITHDLGVVAETCVSVYVMYAGRIVERAAVDALFENPLHPYTAGLIASIPRISGRRKWLETIPGMVPPPHKRGKGCAFADRCPEAMPRCVDARPAMRSVSPEHDVACWKYAP